MLRQIKTNSKDLLEGMEFILLDLNQNNTTKTLFTRLRFLNDKNDFFSFSFLTFISTSNVYSFRCLTSNKGQKH